VTAIQHLVCRHASRLRKFWYFFFKKVPTPIKLMTFYLWLVITYSCLIMFVYAGKYLSLRNKQNAIVFFFVNVSVIGDRQKYNMRRVQANWKGLWIVIMRVAFLFKKRNNKKRNCVEGNVICDVTPITLSGRQVRSATTKMNSRFWKCWGYTTIWISLSGNN
jgi:hypothetical protein